MDSHDNVLRLFSRIKSASLVIYCVWLAPSCLSVALTLFRPLGHRDAQTREAISRLRRLLAIQFLGHPAAGTVAGKSQPRKSKPAEAAARSFTPACEAATVRDAIECCSEHSEKCSPAPQEPSAAPGLVEARHRGYPVRHRATRTAVGSKRHAPRKSCPRDFRRLCRLCLSELGLRSIINRSVGPTRHLPLGGMRQPGELAPNP
jgi:hypothetical protein